MSRARAALLLLVTVAFVPLIGNRQPQAQDQARSHVAYLELGDALPMPIGETLTRAVGVGLMTTRVGPGNRELSAYLTIGAGGTVPGDGRRYLMAEALRQHGVGICVISDLPVSAGVAAIVGPPGPNECLGDDSQSTLLIAERDPSSNQLPAAYSATTSDILRLVLLVAPLPSPQMDQVGDETTTILVGQGIEGQVPAGPARTLTSDSTRQTGLVSNVDVAPTILQFFGIPVPSEMEGHPIRVVDGSPPVALHRLHLEQRRIRIPLQVGEAVFVTLVGLALFGVLIVLGRGRKLSPAMLTALRFLLLCTVALYLVDLVGGLLPRMTYVVVVPFVVLGTLALAWAALAARWPGPVGPFAFLGALGLAFVVVDAVFFGGLAFRVPLTGGTMFDGTRFYGLPNVFIALLLAGSIFVAFSLEPFAGFALIFALGLFAGFPHLGANVGASIVLFAGAGLWVVFGTRPRFRVKEVVLVGVVMLAGLAAVLLANRFFPGSPTHATRFVERSTNSLSTTVSTFRHRLSTAFHLLKAQPEGYVPMLALFVVLWLAIARPEPIRSGFALAGEPWRWAVVAVVLASLVGFVVNDTGTTAAAPGLIYAATGLAYPVFAMEAWKRE